MSILIDSGFEVVFIETTGGFKNLEADIKEDIKYEINNLKPTFSKLNVLFFS